MKREDFFFGLLRDVSGTYVEIGSCWGGFAEFLLNNTGLTKLICVDPYKVFPMTVYNDTLNDQSQKDLDKKFLTVQQRLKNNAAKKPVEMKRLTSYDAHFTVEDNLSFVYIDGNHSHPQVLRDLVSWWPKIKKGGYLCGDDYEDLYLPHEDGDIIIKHATGAHGAYGVATALLDFSKVAKDFHYSINGNQFYAKKL